MTQYFVPEKKVAVVRIGGVDRIFSLRRGIQEVPHELASHERAAEFGIKPLEEMTVEDKRTAGVDPGVTLYSQAHEDHVAPFLMRPEPQVQPEKVEVLEDPVMDQPEEGKTQRQIEDANPSESERGLRE